MICEKSSEINYKGILSKNEDIRVVIKENDAYHLIVYNGTWLTAYMSGIFNGFKVMNDDIDFNVILDIVNKGIVKASKNHDLARSLDFSNDVCSYIESGVFDYVNSIKRTDSYLKKGQSKQNIVITLKEQVCLLAKKNVNYDLLDRAHNKDRLCRVFNIQILNADNVIKSAKVVIDCLTHEQYKYIEGIEGEYDLRCVKDDELICYAMMDIDAYEKSFGSIARKRKEGRDYTKVKTRKPIMR